MAFDVSALSRIVQENADEMLTNIVLNDPFLKSGLVRVETGVKDRRNLNFFTNTNYYQMGNTETPSGNTAINQKYVSAYRFTDYSTDNLADFEQKFLASRLPKGSQYSVSDYPQIIADNIVAITGKDIITTGWRGKRMSGSGNGMADQVEGWFYKAVSYYSAGTHTASTVSTGSAYSGNPTFTKANAIGIYDELMAQLHADIRDRELFSPLPTAAFDALKNACLTDAALALNFSDNDANSFVHPLYGNLTILRAPAMGNQKALMITIPQNLIYITDGESEEDVLEIKEDPIFPNKLHKIMMFKIGFDIALPEYVTYYTWS